MPCFHPLLAILDLQRSYLEHSPRYKFISSEKAPDLYQQMLTEKDRFGRNMCQKYRAPNGVTYRDMIVPCRQCVGCRLEYSRQWANRMLLELGSHDPAKCWFITLTYSEQPLNDQGLMTLRPDDMTAFLKRLREHQARAAPGLGLRYYYSGEYGDQTFRPHYHMIAYSMEIPDLEFLKQTPNGPLFRSNYVDSLWSQGFCFIAQVSWEDCAYTARYMMKKLKGDRAAEYEAFNVVPEFSRMSRRPGIGSGSFSIEDFSKGVLRYVNGRPVTVPDSWKRLMLGCDVETLAKVKNERSLLMRLKALQADGSGYLPSEKCSINEKEILSLQKNHIF